MKPVASFNGCLDNGPIAEDVRSLFNPIPGRTRIHLETDPLTVALEDSTLSGGPHSAARSVNDSMRPPGRTDRSRSATRPIT